MKKAQITLASTLVALTATFAAPSFAMDNPVNESRAKIERILSAQKGVSQDRRGTSVRATTFSAKQPTTVNKYDGVLQRLFRNQHVPSGR